MNQLQIAYFLGVAQCQSFSEAARQLFVAQSAISKQIQALEKSLGVKLFLRTNRNVELTPAGKILFRELKKYNNWLNQIVDMTKQVDQGKVGILNIGVLHGLDLSVNKVNKLAKFTERYPGIQENVQRIKLEEFTNALYVGTHDIIIAYSFLVSDYSDINVAVLGTEKDQIVVSRDHPIGKIAQVTPDELKKYPLITISPDVSRHAYVNSLNYLRDKGITPAIVNHVPTIEDILLSVEFGLGYGISSKSSRLTQNLDAFRFIDLYEDDETSHTTDIIAIWRKDSTNNSIFYYEDFLKKELGVKIK